MSGGGVFTDILAAAGRIFEVMVEGHWETVGMLFDSLGKGTMRINRNAYGSMGVAPAFAVVHLRFQVTLFLPRLLSQSLPSKR